MVKKILAGILLIALLFPLAQQKLNIISSKGLEGYAQPTAIDTLSFKRWMDGRLQASVASWINDSVGFKSDLVRLRNQADWSLFCIPHATRIIRGEDDYLFGEQYLKAWQGADFKSPGYITYTVNLIRSVQDWLWKEKKIRLLVVFAPDKGTYYPEKIPARYFAGRKKLTNYSWYVERCKASGVNHIDFNGWFAGMKDSSHHVLYPKAGIHWSMYGALLAADSLSRYLSNAFGMQVPRIVFDSITLSKTPRGDDYDIGKALNLIWTMDHTPLAYPAARFAGGDANSRPRALFVGDSFYWQWYYQEVIRNFFSNTDFWYYNTDVYPANFSKHTDVSDIDYMQAVFSQNLIVLLQTNAAYGDVGYGIIQRISDHIQKKKK
jgi:hypothetical protein